LPERSKKAESDNRLFYLILMILVGPGIIASSVGTGYYYGVLLGIALEAWGIWETPEIHPYLKLIINWKSRKQGVKVDQSPGAQTITAGRDAVVYNPPPLSQQAQDPTQPKIVPGLSVGFEAYGKIPGRNLVFLEASNIGPVSVFIPSLPSLQVKMPDGKYLIPAAEDWESDKEFPFELKPGRKLTIARELRGFATSMKKNGYSGKVKLTVICRDEANRAFESVPILFDIDDYARAKRQVSPRT